MRTPDEDGRPRQEDRVLNLGRSFDDAVLRAAGVDPDDAQPGSVQIDALPTTGDVTIRFTAVKSAPAATVRDLICQTANPTE